MEAASCCTRNVVGVQSRIHQDVVRVVSLLPQMGSRRENLRAGSRTARCREDLRASQNKTCGCRCGSTGGRKGLNQRKWKAVRLGCLTAHGEHKDESGQQTYMVKGKKKASFVRRDILSGMELMTYQFWTFGVSAIRTCLLAYQPGFWHISRRLAYQPGFWSISQACLLCLVQRR